LAGLLERCQRAKKIGENPYRRDRTYLSVEEGGKRYGHGYGYKYGHGHLDLMNVFDVAWHPPKN